MPSFRLSPERRGVAASTPTRGQMDAGEGTWIPAFAGKTGGGGLYTNLRANGRRGGRGFRLSPERRGVAASTATGGQTDARKGTWIPAFAGKTGGGGVYGNWRANGHLGATWIPAFAGKTGVMMYSVPCANLRANGHRGGRGFRLSPERPGGGGVYANWRATDTEEGTWIPAFAGKTEGKLRNGSCLRGGPPTLPGVLSCALI